MPMTPLPTPPGPTDDVATFNARAFALLGALPAFVTEANALETAVDADATAADADAAAALVARTAAESARDAAVASAGATLWVSGTTYGLGERVYSPADQQVYRRLVAGAGTTDPSLDGTNWARVYAAPELVTAESFFL